MAIIVKKIINWIIEWSSALFSCSLVIGVLAAIAAHYVCGPGTYHNGLGPNNETICPMCSAGSVSGWGASSCTKCPRLTFSYQNRCHNCSEGSISSEGSALCSCKPGFTPGKTLEETLRTWLSGAKSGDPIPDSDWIERSGALCIPCAAGTYKDFVGDRACRICPEGYHSQVGSIRSSDCTPTALKVVQDAIHQAASPLRRTMLAAGAILEKISRSLCEELFGSWAEFERQWRKLFQSCPDGGSYCYGASEAKQCCQTCEDVKTAFLKKGWGKWRATPLCKSGDTGPDECGGCPTCNEVDFQSWLHSTKVYKVYQQALQGAEAAPSPTTCKAAKQELRALMLQVNAIN